jgi:hypothetical protein
MPWCSHRPAILTRSCHDPAGGRLPRRP